PFRRSSPGELYAGKPHVQFLWGGTGNGPRKTLGTAPAPYPTASFPRIEADLGSRPLVHRRPERDRGAHLRRDARARPGALGPNPSCTGERNPARTTATARLPARGARLRPGTRRRTRRAQSRGVGASGEHCRLRARCPRARTSSVTLQAADRAQTWRDRRLSDRAWVRARWSMFAAHPWSSINDHRGRLRSLRRLVSAP